MIDRLLGLWCVVFPSIFTRCLYNSQKYSAILHTKTSNKLCVLHIMMDWAGEPKIQKPKEAKIIKQGAGMAEDEKF